MINIELESGRVILICCDTGFVGRIADLPELIESVRAAIQRDKYLGSCNFSCEKEYNEQCRGTVGDIFPDIAAAESKFYPKSWWGYGEKDNG